MTIAQQRARKEWCKGSVVVRNFWWLEECAIHGYTSYNSIIEGCELCGRERFNSKDVVKK